MNKIIAAITLLATFTTITYSQAPVDGFNKGKGNATIVGAFSNENYTKYYAANGLRNLKRGTQAYSFFGVVGVSDRFDVQMSLPFVVSGPEQSLQDLSIYMKYALLSKGKTKLLGALGQATPLTNYQTEGLYALGQQASVLDTRLILQQDLGNGLFVMAQSGYSKRSYPTPSSVPFSAKIGYASSKIYADLWLDYQHAFGGSDYADGQGLAFTTLGVGYTRIGGQLYKPFNQHLGLSVGGSYVLAGRNVGKAMVLSAALIYNL
ncbi:MAG: hypothetical protein N4A35_15960 [Flavobacteriales bacterium]|jgi:hypothetical protein|nr:hypothetical protein [Flavobacteriales bacterium]